MARYPHLTIWAAAMQLAAHRERAVARVPRHYKHAWGAELRRSARAVPGAVMCCARTTRARQKSPA